MLPQLEGFYEQIIGITDFNPYLVTIGTFGFKSTSITISTVLISCGIFFLLY